jgi:hypothetical protein
MQPVPVKLKLKYRTRRPGNKRRPAYDGNHSSSAGKHTAHPDVFAYRRNGYRCEPKWNVKPHTESE